MFTFGFGVLVGWLLLFHWVGIALARCFVNYFFAKGDQCCFIGVALVMLAVIYGWLPEKLKKWRKVKRKGIWLAVLAGVVMAFFIACRCCDG